MHLATCTCYHVTLDELLLLTLLDELLVLTLLDELLLLTLLDELLLLTLLDELLVLYDRMLQSRLSVSRLHS